MIIEIYLFVAEYKREAKVSCKFNAKCCIILYM